MIALEDLTFAYAGSDFVLRVPALSVAPGERLAVIGPSGSGKTTLLHLVAGIAVPDSGRVVTAGVDLGTLDEGRRRAFRIRKVGLVFQEFELLDYLNVFDNILLPYRISPALDLDASVRERACALARGVGIGDKLMRHPNRLSQGERQRVAVCRALVTGPELLLADEPTGNLDPANKTRVLDSLFEQAAHTGATVLAVTHDHALLDRFERVVDTGALSGPVGQGAT